MKSGLQWQKEKEIKKRNAANCRFELLYLSLCVTLRWTVHGVPRQLPCVSWNWFYPLQPRVYQMDE